MRLYTLVVFNALSQLDFYRLAVELGYNVHGSEESGRVEIPDLTQFIPKIAEDFGNYLVEMLP